MVKLLPASCPQKGNWQEWWWFRCRWSAVGVGGGGGDGDDGGDSVG